MPAQTETELQTKPGDENKPPQFDDKQQAFINELFDKRFAKIKSSADQEKKSLEDTIGKLKDELAEAKKVVKSGGEDSTDGKAAAQETERQLKELLKNEQNKLKILETQNAAKDAEVNSARAESLKIKKEVAITRAAQKQNFIELDVVMAITGHQVEWDNDSSAFVIKENGVVKQNSSLQPMTLEEYYADFAAKRPYLVNGDVLSGTGSAESGKSSIGLVKTKSDLKTAKDKSDYITKFGLDAFEKLPFK